MGTPRKEAEKGESQQPDEHENLFSEEMIKTLFAETPIGVLICDIHGNIKRINKAGVELLGSPSEEATKKINLLTFPPLRNIGVSDILIQCIKERKTLIDELPYISKWEKSVTFRFKLVPIIDEEGVLNEVLCTFEDTSTIRTSEKKRDLYKGIVRNSIEAIAILDATGKYLEQNAAHKLLLGYSDGELEEKTPAIHLGKDVFSNIYDELDKTGQSRKEVKSTTKDGSALDLDLVSFALKDDDGTPEFFIVIKRDITDRKLADKYLRKSERRLAEAQSIAHIGSWEWDIIENQVVWSEENYHIFGRNVDEDLITYDVFLSIVHPEDRELVVKSVDASLNEGIRYSINHRIILPNGEIRVIHEDAELIKDETGNPVAMIGTSQDITDRVQAETTIRESESRYRSLFEYSPISIWEEDFSKVKDFFNDLGAKGVVNFREHFENHPEDVERCVDLVTILDANVASMKLHQARDKNDLLGSLRKFFERDGLEIFKEELIALAEGRTYFRSTDVLLTVKEKAYAFIFQLTVPPRHQQSLSKVYLSIIDVTERMIAEKALQTARDSALFYLDLLGHDITNQLQVIIGGTTLLHRHCDDESIAGRLDDILLAGNKCAQVISKVKTTQDIMSVPLEIKLLDQVLSECITTFSSQHDDTRIIYESEVKEAFVQADKYLDVLFCSILENAILHNPEKKKNVWIELAEANTGFRVSVSDDGVGIPDSRKVALFERSHRFGGVGLHLAKQIVDKYGGSIQVNDRIEGDADSGVKFCIWLPKEDKKE